MNIIKRAIVIMMGKFFIYNIRISFLLLQTTSNLIQPEYSIKILNTENVILSLGDIDDDTNDDLEIIKSNPDNSFLEKKLYDFHKYMNLKEVITENPNKKPNNALYIWTPKFPALYPDSPFEIAMNAKHLSMLERRQRKNRRRKYRLKRKEIRNFQNGFEEVQKVTSPKVVEDAEEEYDYIEKEYMDYVAKSQQENTAFKYSDEGKPEESVKDVASKIFDLKTPKNCTNVTGIGVQAVECAVENFKEGTFNKEEMIYRISAVVILWFGIYLAIALPLWCIKGWCCCCCRCQLCFPVRTVKEIQKYIAQNPPGTYKNSEGEDQYYKPTEKETELYERIRRSIAEF